MKPHSSPRAPTVLLSFRFLGTALIGSLTMALVSIFAPFSAQVASMGSCISILAGLLVASLEQESEIEARQLSRIEQLVVPLALAPEHELYDLYRAISAALNELARPIDPTLRRFALVKAATLADELSSLARGRMVFTATEGWRTVYEELLASTPLDFYRSVAWVRTRDYWQDAPGRQSMRLNFDLARKGLRIERILVLTDDLWPSGSALPTPAVRPWIDQQHEHGIHISLVREKEIANEPEALADFGIYGERAVGFQELDEHARTIRFVLDFDRKAVRLALDRWGRLSLFSSSYAELLRPGVRRQTPGSETNQGVHRPGR